MRLSAIKVILLSTIHAEKGFVQQMVEILSIYFRALHCA